MGDCACVKCGRSPSRSPKKLRNDQLPPAGIFEARGSAETIETYYSGFESQDLLRFAKSQPRRRREMAHTFKFHDPAGCLSPPSRFQTTYAATTSNRGLRHHSEPPARETMEQKVARAVAADTHSIGGFCASLNLQTLPHFSGMMGVTQVPCSPKVKVQPRSTWRHDDVRRFVRRSPSGGIFTHALSGGPF